MHHPAQRLTTWEIISDGAPAAQQSSAAVRFGAWHITPTWPRNTQNTARRPMTPTRSSPLTRQGKKKEAWARASRTRDQKRRHAGRSPAATAAVGQPRTPCHRAEPPRLPLPRAGGGINAVAGRAYQPQTLQPLPFHPSASLQTGRNNRPSTAGVEHSSTVEITRIETFERRRQHLAVLRLSAALTHRCRHKLRLTKHAR